MKTKKMKKIPDIVKRAMTEGIADIGQLSHQDKYQLNKFVKMGILDKGKGGPFPRLKTVFAIKGHDFIEERKMYIDEFIRIAEYENKFSTNRNS